MKTYSSNQIRKVLRRDLGLKPAGRGAGDGHERWVDGAGHSVRPVLRHKEIPHAYIFSLGLALEGQGVCDRDTFLRLVRGR